MEEVLEEVEVEMGARMVARWGSWANMQAVENMESMVTGEVEIVVTLSLQTTPDPGDFLDPPPPSLTLLLLLVVVRSFCLKSRGCGHCQVPSSGPKINRGMAVWRPNS